MSRCSTPLPEPEPPISESGVARSRRQSHSRRCPLSTPSCRCSWTPSTMPLPQSKQVPRTSCCAIGPPRIWVFFAMRLLPLRWSRGPHSRRPFPLTPLVRSSTPTCSPPIYTSSTHPARPGPATSGRPAWTWQLLSPSTAYRRSGSMRHGWRLLRISPWARFLRTSAGSSNARSRGGPRRFPRSSGSSRLVATRSTSSPPSPTRSGSGSAVTPSASSSTATSTTRTSATSDVASAPSRRALVR
jgi:hypothetical protein